MTYKPRRMLVTGGAGFIGAHFIDDQLKSYSDLEIINLDKLTYAGKNACNAQGRYKFIQADICDADNVKTILTKNKIDTIVHFAAESHVDRSITMPENFIKTNVVGTFNLIQSAHEVWKRAGYNESDCRFHHISTDEVYGSLMLNEPVFNENTPYRPRSPYSASKAAADHLVAAFFHTYELPVTLSRCSNNYGPKQHVEKLIPTVIYSCLLRKPIPIYGKGKNIRDWLFVTDHCHGIDAVLRGGKVGQNYNMGGENEWTNLDLVNLICDLMNQLCPANRPYEGLITYVKDREGHDLRYAIDISKMKETFGWMPTISMTEGLKKTIKYYIAQHAEKSLPQQKLAASHVNQ